MSLYNKNYFYFYWHLKKIKTHENQTKIGAAIVSNCKLLNDHIQSLFSICSRF